MILTYKYRVKDSRTAKVLTAYAAAANQVWNFCCEVERKAQSNWMAGRVVRRPTAIDLSMLCTGAGALLGLHSDTVSVICRQFAASRKRAASCPRFRASGGPRRALGWVPFIPRAVRVDGDAVIYLKRRYRFWKSREIDGEFKSGAFVQDSRGRWYITLQCEIAEGASDSDQGVGIDLGLKAVATLSTGETIPALQHYRQYEAALGRAQRAGHKVRARAISAKIANARRHHLHIHTTRIARENALIAVGNVRASNLKRTTMAKSVSDAGWFMLKSQLRYKASKHGARFIEVNEAWTSQVCSDCGSIGGPKGRKGLGIRAWECADCGVSHDRDVNAARNILRLALECQRPVEGIAA